MIYIVSKNTIKVTDKTQFNPEHILECGQIFRYSKLNEHTYSVVSKDKIAHIFEREDCYEIKTSDTDYFINFFDLNTDYTAIKGKLKEEPTLSPMVDFGYGLRLLNNDAHEMIFSYIISQNNNISRIQKIIERLCMLGKEMTDAVTGKKYHAFPSIEELSNANMDFYSGIGAGYRDKFLKATADSLKNVDIESLKQLSTDDLIKFLVSQKGIGIKVASCIVLFGFCRRDKFPVDTWLEQVYYNHFESQKRTRPQIQEYFEAKFKENSGLAQQYLFYYERSHPHK